MTESRPRGRPRAFDRDAALEAAMRLFWERGYEATSVADLTTALGIGAASFYAAFTSKQALFFETVRRYRDQADGSFDPAKAPSAGAFVTTMLHDAARRFTHEGSPRGCMVISAATNCGPASETVEQALREQRRHNEAMLAARIAVDVEAGLLPEGTRPAALAKLFATVLQGMSVQARDGASHRELLDVADAALALFPARTPRVPRAR